MTETKGFQGLNSSGMGIAASLGMKNKSKSNKFYHFIFFSALLLSSALAMAAEPKNVDVFYIVVNKATAKRIPNAEKAFSVSQKQIETKRLRNVSELALPPIAPVNRREATRFLTGSDEVLTQIDQGLKSGLITGIAFVKDDMVLKKGRFLLGIDAKEVRVRVNFSDKKGQPQVAWLDLNRFLDQLVLEKLNIDPTSLETRTDRMVQRESGLWVHQDRDQAERDIAFGAAEEKWLESLRSARSEKYLEEREPSVNESSSHTIPAE